MKLFLFYLIGGISIGKELNHRGDWYFGVLNDNEDLITVRSVMDQKRNGGKPCPADCNGQGQCQDGVCQCYPQYSGLDCSQSKYRVSHIIIITYPPYNKHNKISSRLWQLTAKAIARIEFTQYSGRSRSK